MLNLNAKRAKFCVQSQIDLKFLAKILSKKDKNANNQTKQKGSNSLCYRCK